jgi:hypothetical protein
LPFPVLKDKALKEEYESKTDSRKDQNLRACVEGTNRRSCIGW